MSETLPTPGQLNWSGPLNTVLGDLDVRLSKVEPTFSNTKVVYVTTGGSDSNAGASPGTAFATIAAAVAWLVANSSSVGAVQVGPGAFTLADTLTLPQGIKLIGAGPGAAISGGTEITYTGTDDGRAAIQTASSTSTDFTHGRIENLRLLCTAGYTQAIGLLARNMQNMALVRNLVLSGFPVNGVKVVDTLAGSDHQYPGYISFERVWVIGGTRPWYITPGTTTMKMDLCAVDGRTGTTEAIYVDAPNGGGTRARDFRLAISSFKYEAASGNDSYGVRIIPDTNVQLQECTFQLQQLGTKAAVRYEGVPADPNDSLSPTVSGTWTAQGNPIWFESPNTTPAVKINVPTPGGGNSYRDTWPPASSAPVHGDGVDGDVVFDGTTTLLGIVPSSNTYVLNRDIYLNTGLINSSVTINSNGYRIHARMWLYGPSGGTGTIKNSGGAGAAGGTAGGTAGVGSISQNTAGGAGTTTAGAVGTNTTRACGGQGGAGGLGSSGAGGTTSVPAGAGTTSGATNAPRRFPECFGMAFAASGSWGGGTGGGGGGGDSTVLGGGGGGGGGVVVVASPRLGNLSIQANGGNGGTPASGNAGGGGGGGGGVVTVITSRALPSSVALQANGGTGGGKTGTGVIGSNGATGQTVTLLCT